MDAALAVAFQIGVMFILIGIGFFCYKTGMITSRGNQQISNFVVSLVLPVMVFVSLQKKMNDELVRGLLISAGIAVLSHVLLIAVSTLMIRRKNNPDCGVERFAAAYSNCAFIGIPLVQAVYGSDGVFYLTAYIAVFNLFMWTHGILLVKDKTDLRSVLKSLVSPAMLSTALGLIFFIFQIFLPPILIRPLEYIASLVTPLAMILSGVTIAQTNILHALKKPRIYYVQFIKLLLVPALILVLLSFFDIPEAVLNTCVLAAACPTATSSIMVAYKYKKNALYSSELLAFSTLLSAATLPLLLAFSGLIL